MTRILVVTRSVKVLSMHSRFVVRSMSGELLGIFPAPIHAHAGAIRALMADNPGAEVRAMVSVENPCRLHPPFEADNCPACGTHPMHGSTHPRLASAEANGDGDGTIPS